MVPSSPGDGRRRAGAALGRATAITAVAAVLTLSGCTTYGPWADDTDGAIDAKESIPEDHAAPATSGPALEVAVLDPADYARAISHRKQALAGTTPALPSAADTGYYLDVQEAQLRQALDGTGIGLFRDNLDIRLRISGTEAFDTASTRLNPAVEQVLATVAEVLKDYRLTLVVVHGHTDAAGDTGTNQRLSEQRALAVAGRLVASGLEAERIVTVGHGESRPLAHDTSPESRWPDRRIEIELELIGG